MAIPERLLPPLARARRLFDRTNRAYRSFDAGNLMLMFEELLLHLEETQQVASGQRETPSFLPDIEKLADAQNGSSISSWTYSLVREGPTGELRTMATVTYHVPSSRPTLGDVLKRLLATSDLVQEAHEMSGSRSRYGVVPFPTQEAREAGPSVGGEATSPDSPSSEPCCGRAEGWMRLDGKQVRYAFWCPTHGASRSFNPTSASEIAKAKVRWDNPGGSDGN